MEDILRSLGHLCLGSRFKRVAERLQADTQQLLDELDVPVPSGQHPFLAALYRLGPLTVGELAEAIGISQPGVTRGVANLSGLGLVEARPGKGDQRRRIVALTADGRALVEAARRHVWPRVEAAVAEVCAELSGPLLDQLDTIEQRLVEASLGARAERLRSGGQ